MFKTFRSILHSIKTVDDYVLEGKKRGENHDKRIINLQRATVDGEQNWFSYLRKEDPDCLIKVFKECDNDKSTK